MKQQARPEVSPQTSRGSGEAVIAEFDCAELWTIHSFYPQNLDLRGVGDRTSGTLPRLVALV